ncbi:MAG: hypothetical protein LBR15_07650, partial [Methanobrevibacter sp.]|nr:hypothetical protein [Candidatus Methanovirga australis]
TGTPLKELKDINIYRGILTGFNEAFIINSETRNDLIAKDPKNREIIKPLLRGRDIHRWSINYQNLYLITTKNGIYVPKEYPTIYEHLKLYEDKLTKRYDKGEYWYNLRNCAYYEEFEKQKIIWSEIRSNLSVAFDKNNFFIDKTCFMLVHNNDNVHFLKFLSSLMSSKLLNFAFRKIGSTLGDKGLNLSKIFIEQLPIIIISKEEQKPLIDLTTEIIAKNHELHKEIKSFHKYLKSDFKVTNINKKLTEYYNLGFEDLYAEVKKQYKDITRKEKDKLEKEYNESIAILKPLQAEIDRIDKEIDKLVYELYDLNKKEIEIIERG